MPNPLVERYVKQHSELFERSPDVLLSALSRYSELHAKSERWLYILMLGSLIASIIALAQLLGAKLTAEFYGQRIADLPENTFLAVSVAGIFFLFGMMYGICSALYDGIFKWSTRQLYGNKSDIIYRSFLGVEVFAFYRNLITAVDRIRGEKLLVFSLRVCLGIVLFTAFLTLVFPIFVMYYFCYQIAGSASSLAVIEWWFVGALATIDLALLLVGATSSVTVAGLD